MWRLDYGRLPRTALEKEMSNLTLLTTKRNAKHFDELPAGFATFTMVLDSDEPVNELFRQEILSKYPEAILCAYEFL